MTRLNTLVASLAITASLGACAPGGSPSDGPRPARGDETRVRVTNNNWSDMAVYVVRAGMRTRLGTVTSMQTATFRIPTSIVSTSADIRLVADPIGGQQTFMTPAVLVWPGQRLDFTIQNHLAISSLAVWN